MRCGRDREASEPGHGRWFLRECPPGMIGFLGLLAIVALGRLADRRGWWFHGQDELLSLIITAAATGAFCLLVPALARLTGLNRDISIVRRITATVFFMAMGIKVGLRYVHLCQAGSRWIEITAILGTPLLAGAVVIGSGNRFVKYSLAAAILVAVWLLARPYLDWAHGN